MFMTYVYKYLFFSLLYFLSSKVGILLSIPTGPFSIFSPEIGIGLAGVLILGYRFWPAIFILSFLSNTQSIFQVSNFLSLSQFSIPVLILASVATAQVLLGAFFVSCFIETPLSLENEVSILKFFFVTGPISNCICTAIGTTLLLMMGVFETKTFLLNWGVWFLGGTFGVIIITPLVMAFFGEGEPFSCAAFLEGTFIESIFAVLAINQRYGEIK